MIDFYTAGTPNGRKVAIALEELGLPYTVFPLALGEGEQKAPEYLALNPNGKIPTIVDRGNGDFVVFESGAILIYLAELTARLLPETREGRSLALQWLMFQMGGLGPMMGQAGHFLNQAPEPMPYAIARYQDEAERLFGVLDARLARVPYLAGETYSIADIATYPWVAAYERIDLTLDDTPSLRRWFGTVGERAAVQRGMQIPA